MDEASVIISECDFYLVKDIEWDNRMQYDHIVVDRSM